MKTFETLGEVHIILRAATEFFYLIAFQVVFNTRLIVFKNKMSVGSVNVNQILNKILIVI